MIYKSSYSELLITKHGRYHKVRLDVVVDRYFIFLSVAKYTIHFYFFYPPIAYQLEVI